MNEFFSMVSYHTFEDLKSFQKSKALFLKEGVIFEIPKVNLTKKFAKEFLAFWTDLHDYIPSEFLDEVKEIDMSVCKFGSIGVNLTWWKNDNSKIEIVKRVDADMSYFFYLVLLERLTKHQKELQITDWVVRITLLNYLVFDTNLKKHFNNISHFLISIYDKNGYQFRNESNEYLRELGCFQDTKLEVKGQNILIDKVPMSLTKSEFSLFKVLIQNKNAVVDFDTLAKELWGKQYIEKFSYAAIVKIIERIRVKRSLQKVNKLRILAIRGIGYRLVL